MLKIEDLSFAYGGGTPVLADFSMELGRNEIVSLLGPSGCGKSTVLRLIADLLQPRTGTVSWQHTADLAFVFQDHALMPWASLRENVALPGKLSGTFDADAVSSAIDAVGLSGMEARYPSQLSGGQRMRASVARALAAKPKTLLMDEPFAALDEILRFQMNELLLALSEERGFNVIFVTHSLFEAAYLSDRVLVMKNGHVSGELTPILDRTLSAEDQRASSAFLKAVKEISALMAKEDK